MTDTFKDTTEVMVEEAVELVLKYAKDELDNTGDAQNQGRNGNGEEPSKDEAGQARD